MTEAEVAYKPRGRTWRLLFEPGAWAAPFAILFSTLLIRPVGEFPVLDDFDYVATVRDFLHTGEIRLSDWPSMTLIGQVYWGAAFSTLLGDTFLSLRISTLVLHAIGCIAAYLWMRDRGASQNLSAFAAVAVATSPETLYFACSFMTDTPGLAWMLILLLASSRSLTSTSLLAAVVAGTVAALAYLFRQTAVIPLLAAILVELFRGRFRHVAALTIPAAVVAVLHRCWLHQHGIPHHVAIPMINPSLLTSPVEMFNRIARITATVGLYILPASLLFLSPANPRSRDRFSRRLALAVAVSATVAAFVVPSFIPYDNSTVFDFGIGADMSLDRTYVLDGPSAIVVGLHVSVFRCLATSVAVLSLAAASVSLHRTARRADPAIWQLRVSIMGAVAFSLIAGSFYERYLIPAWSLAILGLAASSPRPSRIAWTALLAFVAWGVIGAEDYFRRFGAVWDAAEELRAVGVPATSIDAGMEFAGWYQFNPRYRGTEERVRPYISELSEWKRIELIAPMVLNRYTPYRMSMPYVVSYADDGEIILRRHPYRSWLRRGVVYTLQRPRK